MSFHRKTAWRVLAVLFTGYLAGNLAAQSAPPLKPASTVQNAGKAETPVALDPHPVVAITFDDLPAAGSLPPGQSRARIATALTAELRAGHLEGTYGFVNAVALQNDSDAQQSLRIWLDAGMNIGNHTWSHPGLNDNTAEAFEHNIALDQPALEQYGELRDWHWFRFPYLAEGNTLAKRRAVRKWLHNHYYRTAEVTLDFGDYEWNEAYARCSVKPDEKAIAWLKKSYLENAAEYIRVGREEERLVWGHEIPNVLLLHASAFTTLMLPGLLSLLRSEGFSFESLAEVERNPAYSQNPDIAHPGGTFTEQFMDARHLTYPVYRHKPTEKLESICR